MRNVKDYIKTTKTTFAFVVYSRTKDGHKVNYFKIPYTYTKKAARAYTEINLGGRGKIFAKCTKNVCPPPT